LSLSFIAIITVDAKDKSKSIYDSINVDNEFYPENPVKTLIEFNENVVISVESGHLAHLRANLNSTLRLIQASYDSINE
jgi:KEOPS complex subunit Pcc1